MAEMTIGFLGDVVGEPGRRAFARAAPILRERHRVDVLIVNGENAKHGSGLSAIAYKSLREVGGRTGADAVTLGDHCFREKQVIPLVEDETEPVAIPANWAADAPGKRFTRVAPARAGLPPVYVVTVLGRLGMHVYAGCPFEAVDRVLGAIAEPEALAVVEVHGEATSEKQAMAHHCLRAWAGRVVAVVGTHTHVQTADARLLERQLGAITDLGMTGPHNSVIGRKAEDALRAMRTQTPTVLDVADGDEKACGAVIRVDAGARRAVAIEAVQISA